MMHKISLFIFFNIILSSFIGQVACTLSADLHLDMIDTSNFKITKLQNHYDAFLITPNKKINDVFINEKPVWTKTEKTECVSATIYNTDKPSVIISLKIRENNSESVLIYERSEQLMVDTGVCYSSVTINKQEPPKVPTKCGEKSCADASTQSEEPAVSSPSSEPTKDEKTEGTVLTTPAGSPAKDSPAIEATPGPESTPVKEAESAPSKPSSQTDGPAPPVQSPPATSPNSKPEDATEPKSKDVGTSMDDQAKEPAKPETSESPEKKTDKEEAVEATPIAQAAVDIVPFHLDVSEDIDRLFVNFYEKRGDGIVLNVYESTAERLISSVHDGTNLVAIAKKGHFSHVECYKLGNEPLLVFLTDGSEELYFMKNKQWSRINQKAYAERFKSLKLDQVRDGPEQSADRYTIDLNTLFRTKPRQSLNASFYNNFVYVLRPQPLDTAEAEVQEAKTSTDSAANTGEQAQSPVKTAKTLIVAHAEASSGNKVNAATNTENTRDASTNTSFGLNQEPIVSVEKGTMTDRVESGNGSAQTSSNGPNSKENQQTDKSGSAEGKAQVKSFKSVGTMTTESSIPRSTTTTGTMANITPKYTIVHNGRPVTQVEAEILELSVMRLNNRNVYLELITSVDGVRGPSIYFKKVHFSGCWMKKSQSFFAKDLKNSINEFIRETATKLAGTEADSPEAAAQGVHEPAKKHRSYLDLFAHGETSPANALSDDLVCKLKSPVIPDKAATKSEEDVKQSEEKENEHEEKDEKKAKETEKEVKKDVEVEKQVKNEDKKALKGQESSDEDEDDDEDGFVIPGIGLTLLLTLLFSN